MLKSIKFLMEIAYSYTIFDIMHLFYFYFEGIFYELVKKSKPHWNIFFDIEELKAGHSWQKRLYESIGKSKLI